MSETKQALTASEQIEADFENKAKELEQDRVDAESANRILRYTTYRYRASKSCENCSYHDKEGGTGYCAHLLVGGRYIAKPYMVCNFYEKQEKTEEAKEEEE